MPGIRKQLYAMLGISEAAVYITMMVIREPWLNFGLNPFDFLW